MPKPSALLGSGSSFEDFAATIIQKIYRGYAVRRGIKKQVQAVDVIAHQWLERSRRRSLPAQAAPVIQRAWRYFSQRRIFKYYKDLIKFREKGNPSELLRCINFRESQLADAAAGTHVRFRLGGATFPPLVFYKIYTHHAVTDINSFCPRDYVRGTAKTQDDIKIHNYRNRNGDFYSDFVLDAELRQYKKPDGTIGLRDEKGWYQRYENNGWRPVAERGLVDADDVTRATAILKGNFSHIPQQRREEVARRRKQRKREWMAKVYMLGKQGKEPRDLQDDFEGEASMIDLDVHDDEELLKWSEALDFDSYLDTWTMTATSNSTEAYIPQNYAALMEEESVLVMADSATLFAQKRMPSEPFKGGTGVTTLNFRASDLRT